MLLTIISLLACKLSHGEISKAYIVYSNHFDAGYTKNEEGSCTGAVINQYFEEHFPKAIATSNEARSQGKFQYRWMTQSWLVNIFRHCNTTKINIKGPSAPSDVRCPSAANLTSFEAAVKRGDITWHALPFNAEPETFTPNFVETGVFLHCIASVFPLNYSH